VVEDLRRIYPRFDPALLGVVECLASDEGAPEESSDDRVHRVGSPADLTGVGIGASELLNAFHREGVDGFRLGVDSLSTLLLYTEFDRLARFLHVLSGRIDRADGVGLFVINPNTVDAGQFDQLTTLFDGIVELREEDGGREIRVRGIPGADAEWRPYVPPEFD
jgi:KaiC/GvpD/RAD55 family RecA-like ATPase